jgi:PAS domain S-box-containing protein
MPWQDVPYVLPLLLAAAISASLALYAWQRRSTPAAVPFVWLLVAVAEWSVGYALELASADLSLKVFWARVQYFGIVAAPVTWFIFARQYARGGRPLARRYLLLAAIIPLATLILVWTNNAHHLIWTKTSLSTRGPFAVLEVTYGPWFWIHSAYSYGFMMFGTFLIFQSRLQSAPPYRGQAIALLLAALAPWLGNLTGLLGLVGLLPIRGLDLTPFGFTVTGLACAWGLFRLGLLDLVPVARDAVVDGMGDGVLVLDPQGRIVDVNPAARAIAGRSRAAIMGEMASQVFPTVPEVSPANLGLEVTRELVRLGEGDDEGIYDLRVRPLLDRRSNLTGWVVVLHDITVHHRAEEQIRSLKEFNEGIVQNMAEGIVVQDADGNLTFVNPAAARLLGHTPEGLLGQHWTAIIPPDQQPIVQQADQRRASGESDHYEVVAVRKGGTRLPLLVHGSPIMDADTGKFAGTLAVFTDITERVQAEDRLRSSLQEKEVLLQEVHHRVKNNLQIVSSLLDMQCLSVDSPDAIDALQDSRNRVKAMAVVHERLYQSPDLASVDVVDYVQGIVKHLALIYQYETRGIRCDVEVRDVVLGLDAAIPCGLIINELVSNALKHGFPLDSPPPGEGEDERYIRIALYSEEQALPQGDSEIGAGPDETRIALEVSDNGVGPPPDADLLQPQSLGLQLVTTLVLQLQGTIEIDVSGGTAFKITFPSQA